MQRAFEDRDLGICRECLSYVNIYIMKVPNFRTHCNKWSYNIKAKFTIEKYMFGSKHGVYLRIYGPYNPSDYSYLRSEADRGSKIVINYAS
jgi:hypothetical protein